MSKHDKKWQGNIGPLIEKHLALRRAIGRVGKADHSVLYRFNNFLIENYPKLKIPNRIAILHFMKTKSHLSNGGKRNIIIYIRQFCMFLNQRGIPCYMPDKTLIPQYTYEPRYCPISKNMVSELMAIIKNNPRYPNRKYTGQMYSTLMGLLWVTGMRSGEALRLKHRDIDFDNNLILITQTKFFKDRIVPIHTTTANELQKFVALKITCGFGCNSDDYFFMNMREKKISKSTITHMFKRMTDQLNIKNEDGRSPVMHDLRHNFATQWIYRFYQDTGKYPPQSWIPRLSTYLGHSDMKQSQYYLHPDFDLLQKASTNFKLDDIYER